MEDEQNVDGERQLKENDGDWVLWWRRTVARSEEEMAIGLGFW
jgi:hypothetical protein